MKKRRIQVNNVLRIKIENLSSLKLIKIKPNDNNNGIELLSKWSKLPCKKIIVNMPYQSSHFCGCKPCEFKSNSYLKLKKNTIQIDKTNKAGQTTESISFIKNENIQVFSYQNMFQSKLTDIRSYFNKGKVILLIKS